MFFYWWKTSDFKILPPPLEKLTSLNKLLATPLPMHTCIWGQVAETAKLTVRVGIWLRNDRQVGPSGRSGTFLVGSDRHTDGNFQPWICTLMLMLNKSSQINPILCFGSPAQDHQWILPHGIGSVALYSPAEWFCDSGMFRIVLNGRKD